MESCKEMDIYVLSRLMVSGVLLGEWSKVNIIPLPACQQDFALGIALEIELTL